MSGPRTGPDGYRLVGPYTWERATPNGWVIQVAFDESRGVRQWRWCILDSVRVLLRTSRLPLHTMQSATDRVEMVASVLAQALSNKANGIVAEMLEDLSREPTAREIVLYQQEQEAKPAVCIECGAPVAQEHLKEAHDDGLCFGCWFWYEALGIDAGDPDRVVIVDGRHYRIGEEPTPGYSGTLGFGGRKWRIRFKDGREVTTHNLWHQGGIPESFRTRLPDNAEFVPEPERKLYPHSYGKE